MTNKKIVGLALAAVLLPAVASAATIEELQAQINALMAQLSAAKPATTASCSVVLSKTLKMGMSDAEVMDLQKALNSDVATQVAASGVGSKGNETSYFGAATKAAVVKFQNKYASEVLAPAGLSTGTGLVGAATRAKINALCSATVTTPTTTTGNQTTVTGLNGVAGSMSLTKYTGDTETDVVTGASKNVASFKVQADGSDVKVTHLKIDAVYTGISAASNYLNRYFTKFDVFAGDTKVGTVAVEDFIRDSAGHYSKTIALDSAVVRMGSDKKVTFSVKATGVSTIDSDNAGSSKGKWTVDVLEARFVDATGVVLSTTPASAIAFNNINVTKLSTSSDVKVKYSSGAANPEAKVVFVSDSNSGDKVVMNEFKIKAEGTDVNFDVLKIHVVSAAGTSTVAEMVSEFQLVRGGTVVDTVDPMVAADFATTSGIATFNLDTPEKISMDQTVTYQIVAKMQKIKTGTFLEGNALTVDLDASATATNAQDKNGDAVGTFSGSATGKTQTFRSTGLNIAKVSSTNTVTPNSTDTTKSYGEFKMQVKVTASGDDIWVPLTTASSTAVGAGVNYSMKDSSGNIVAANSASIALVSGGTRENTNYVKIADGESATFEVVVTLDPAASGQYRLQLNDVGYTLAGATGSATAQIAATPVEDFQSSLSYIQN